MIGTAFDGYRLAEKDIVPRSRPCSGDQPVLLHLAEHRADLRSGRSIPTGDFVWPPKNATSMRLPRGGNLTEDFLRRVRKVVPFFPGRRTLARNHSGLPPIVAMSFGIGRIPHRFRCPRDEVIGSVVARRYLSRNDRRASSPIEAPANDSVNRRCVSTDQSFKDFGRQLSGWKIHNASVLIFIFI